jgi:glucose/arabinose dehydrogenase
MSGKWQRFLACAFFGIIFGCGNENSAAEAGDPQSTSWPSLKLTKVASGATRPTAIVNAGDGSGRLFVVEQKGRVLVLLDGVFAAEPFLDISYGVVSGGEQGLLGMAFPPGIGVKGYFYLNYTQSPLGSTVVSRFHISPTDPDVALSESEEMILLVAQPFSNHNAGQLAFGPDGFLYVGFGDGGSDGDPLGNGQNGATLLGSMVRIDVESGKAPYAIPPDNPFVRNPAVRNEIWALGLRNPWRYSFDRKTGDLYIADVGQNAWEEVNFQPAASAGGANYGWNILEGPACFNPPVDCVPPAAYVPPVAFYNHFLGCSITGGFVYRGPENPDLQGIYFFADFCTGRIWGLRRSGDVWESRVLAETPYSISTFGEDEEGRLYLADLNTGSIYRIDQQ